MRHICTAVVATLVLAGTSFAATINVPGDYTTIQAAVDAADNGDEILVAPGTYTGTGYVVVDTLGKSITLRASGTPEETIIDGEGARRVVECSGNEGADTIIEGFTITGGSSPYSGGIYCYGSSPTIAGCTIEGNTASEWGGGIYCKSNSNPLITGCTITGNTANDGGGICCTSSSPTITNCTISENLAYEGGGFYSDSADHIIIVDSSISENAAFYGGGIYSYSGIISATNTIISRNYATYFGDARGGGIYMEYAELDLQGCELTDNFSESFGGAICSVESQSMLDACTVQGNEALVSGGGIHHAAAISWISNSDFCDNQPDHIYGLWVDDEGNTFDVVCEPAELCLGNTNEDYDVDVLDLLYVIAVYGSDNDAGDQNDDGVVDVNDLLTVITNWGPCP